MFVIAATFPVFPRQMVTITCPKTTCHACSTHKVPMVVICKCSFWSPLRSRPHPHVYRFSPEPSLEIFWDVVDLFDVVDVVGWNGAPFFAE